MKGVIDPGLPGVIGSRIRWQCRRGTRELDYLLLGWFESCYESATEKQKSAFRSLLELQDPELIVYLLGNARPADSSLADVIQSIRTRTSSG